MGYYNIYDSNDNLIASDVWIDDGLDGGSTRPIVINWRKLLMIILFFIGTNTTFILPLILYFNRDGFIKGGWILMSLSNMIIGLPVFIISLLMLITLRKTKNIDGSDDEMMKLAQAYVNTNIIKKPSLIDDEISDDEISDVEYINNRNAHFKYETAVARVYLAIKFEKYLRILSLLSYLVYPIGILCFIAEIIYGATEVYMIILGILNNLVLFLGVLSIYKNYKRYKIKYSGSILKRMICVALGTFFLGVSVGLVIMTTLGAGGYCILCLFVMLFDMIALIDTKLISNNNIRKRKIHIWPIVVISIIVGIVATFVACGLSIMPGPIYDALLAYDSGLSTDLTLPIIVWSICGIVAILLIVFISIRVNKRLNNIENNK